MGLALRLAVAAALVAAVVLALVLIVGSNPTADHGSGDAGRTFFVSGRGSDSGPGTRSQPWRTLERAEAAVGPGDTVFVGRGEYGRERPQRRIEFSAAGTAEAPISWLRNPDEARPTFDGSLRITGAHNRVSGFLFEGPSGPIRENGEHEDVLVWINGDNVRLDHSEVRKSRWHAGVFVSRADEFSVDHDYIHDNGIRANLDHGVYISTDATGCVQDDVIADNRAWGVHLYPDATGVVISHNSVVGNGRGGIIVARASAQNLLVGNVVAGNHEYGIRAYELTGSANVAYGNDVYGQETDLAGDGMAFRYTTEAREPGPSAGPDEGDVCAEAFEGGS
jgi:Right handed beta helix region